MGSLRQKPCSCESELSSASKMAIVDGLRFVGDLVVVLNQSAAVIDGGDLICTEAAIVAVEVGVWIQFDVHSAEFERTLADRIHAVGMIRHVNVIVALPGMFWVEASEAIHVEVGDDGIERHKRILDKVGGTASAFLFRSSVQEDDGAAGTVARGTGGSKCVGHLDETDGAGAVVGSAVEYLVTLPLRVAPEVIVVGGDDNIFFAQRWIGAGQEGNDIFSRDRWISLELRRC